MGANQRGITEGMNVYSADGEKLGKVINCGGTQFEIEKGFFFPKDYLVSYTDITNINGNDVYLSYTRDRLRSGEGYGTTTGTTTGRAGTTTTTPTEMRVPVVEEQLEVERRAREAGAVRVTKDVVTETKNISVPVTREEVRVERVPMGTTAKPGDTNFEKESVTVPVIEEEIEIRKRPVVKEEVRISKEARTETKDVSEKLRREKVEVEEDASTVRRRDYDDEPGMHAGPRSMDDIGEDIDMDDVDDHTKF